MKIAAKDLAIGMMFVADTRLYRVVDIFNDGIMVQIDCRRPTELGDVLSDFYVPPSHEFDLPEVP
jgi:hypothetical protein